MKTKTNKWLEARRELMFPDVKKFDELFTVADKRHHLLAGGVEVSTYCSVSELGSYHHSLEVTPKPELLKFIEEHMLPINGGVFFEIVTHKDGKALVIVKYNCICGSRWLAKVKTNTIPF